MKYFVKPPTKRKAGEREREKERERKRAERRKRENGRKRNKRQRRQNKKETRFQTLDFLLFGFPKGGSKYACMCK